MILYSVMTVHSLTSSLCATETSTVPILILDSEDVKLDLH